MANQDFKAYLDDYDRTAKGAGSDKGKDRLSAKDIGEMFRGRGDLSAQEGAQGVLDYFAANKGDTSHGGGTAKAIEKMTRIAGRDFETDDNTGVSPNIQLSQRAAEAIGGTKSYEEAQASGLLSEMRGLGSDNSGASDAFNNYKDMYKSNVMKAMSPNAGIQINEPSDTGTAGGGEFTFTPARSEIAEKVIGKGAGLQNLLF